MDICKINNINLPNFSIYETKNNVTQKYGIRMANPIQSDTVSFKGAANTNKTLGSLADAITNKLAQDLISIYKRPHKIMHELIQKNFSDILSTNDKKGLIKLEHRIKKAFSICEKTTSIDVWTKTDILNDMRDISGFAFILESPKAFQQFLTRTAKMVRNKEIKVVDLEYYRLPPKMQRGKEVENYDSLNVNSIRRFGSVVDEVNNSNKSILNEKPSPAGYSGLHITLQDKDGLYHEWQIMTRAMWNLKEIENFFYKMKEKKTIDPKYTYIKDVLRALRPLPDYATKKEQLAYKIFMNKIKQYTVEAYKERLKKPFEDRNTFLSPSDPEIKKYDFNNIYKLKKMCNEIS